MKPDPNKRYERITVWLIFAMIVLTLYLVGWLDVDL